MKNILLATFLTAIFASGALGQYHGYFSYPGSGSEFEISYTSFWADPAWQLGESTLPQFDSLDVVAINLNEPTLHIGEYVIQATLNREYSPIGFCLQDPNFEVVYKLCGISDSTGLIIEFSWDSVTWWNMADTNQIIQFFETAPCELIPGLPTFPSSEEVDTLIDGRIVFDINSEWTTQVFFVPTLWTFEGAGSLYEFHMRLIYVNLVQRPIVGLGIKFLNLIGGYWCEIGINDYEGNLDANIYPNPVTECSVLEMPGNTTFPARFQVVDPLGHVVANMQLYSNIFQLSSLELKPGIYFYRLTDRVGNYKQGSFYVKY